ncbi:GFA family protein [Denitrobaculum tricleocarpae]|uniref:GFA family protein n=1 Tax=Denitrobaculum tricleocarpae TaxID=2591009 RepID=A0A545T093_9PROT|nr:GFA family protein [Denitrobaculum tricleocarpae]TQV70643.1 GFA family protein [Denitrobaculum tricleocarpae]
MNKQSGGCACGAVRYEASGKTEFAFHCHCRKCQRITGSGHASAFALHRDDIELTGEVREFEQMADNGAATYSGFCPKCGSPIFSRTVRFPDRLYLHVATLDDPSRFEPKFVVYEQAAQPWDYIDPALQAAPR